MEVFKTEIEGLMILKPRVFEDTRGYFYESYNKEEFGKLGIEAVFVQDNQSLSSRGVLRGMHFQRPPFAQGKLVRVIRGAVFDVAVDIRRHSPTFGKWTAVELSEENKLMFWIPEGFAHGFLTLRDHTIFSYKCTNLYNREAEGSIRWDDPDLAIDWPLKDVSLSNKDLALPQLREIESPF